MTPPQRSPCPVACTLDLLGDRWTLLVIRDMMFLGKQRFEEFLESPEGISTNILASRLKQLEELGLVEKQLYGSHSRRMNYRLTDKGNSLRPVLKVMAAWGLKHIDDTQLPPTDGLAVNRTFNAPSSTAAPTRPGAQPRSVHPDETLGP
jgi:DNA-binding HxlR family transcriptional regulator